MTISSEIHLEADRVALIADLVRRVTTTQHNEPITPDLIEASAESARLALEEMRRRRELLGRAPQTAFTPLPRFLSL